MKWQVTVCVQTSGRTGRWSPASSWWTSTSSSPSSSTSLPSPTTVVWCTLRLAVLCAAGTWEHVAPLLRSAGSRPPAPLLLLLHSLARTLHWVWPVMYQWKGCDVWNVTLPHLWWRDCETQQWNPMESQYLYHGFPRPPEQPHCSRGNCIEIKVKLWQRVGGEMRE